MGVRSAPAASRTVFLGSAAEDMRRGALVTVDHHRGFRKKHQPGWEYHDPTLVDPHSGTLDTSARFRRTMFDAGLEQTVIKMLARRRRPPRVEQTGRLRVHRRRAAWRPPRNDPRRLGPVGGSVARC